MTLTPEQVLELKAEEVIARLQEAGLREQGGAGRLLADRWLRVREAPGAGKVVVCNAVDGDRRAEVSGFVLRRNPRAVLDGLLIAGHAVGADSCVVCVDPESEGFAALTQAVEGAPASGGSGAAGIRVVEVPASLVTGEETALIRALEGRQPLPYLRGAGSAAGAAGAPTLVETAETLAAVAAVFSEQDGVEGAGTKVIAVFGDVTKPGTVEVPLGTTIRAAIEQVEGRPLRAAEIKAVQFGGPAGPFLAGEALETPIDHETLREAGTGMGWGGVEVFAAGRCGVEMARDITARLHEESCGKCVFCREGSRQVLDILNEAVEGRATEEQMDLLRELGEAMKPGSICSLGQGAALPALSAAELFADDFAAHLQAKRCPGAGR